MKKAYFADPRRKKEFHFGGPHFIEGWVNEDGTRFFTSDRKTMWFSSTMRFCSFEGLNYEGHKIG